MVTPSSAPVGGAGRPVPRLPGPPPPGGQFRPPPPNPRLPRRPDRPSLTKAQQTRLALICSIAVVLGALGGLVATFVLPHVYAAQVTIRYNVGDNSSAAENVDRTLTTQTVVITSRRVLQPVSDSTSVPVDYLTKNVTATVVPNSEIIQVQVKHPDRTSGVQLADAVAKQYLQVANASSDQPQLQAQLDNAQRLLANPATPPATISDLQAQVNDLQGQLGQSSGDSDLATVVAPASSLPAPVFPNTLVTLVIGLLVGALAGALIAVNLVRRWNLR